ncbi:DsbA family oxidoreductase [Thiospirochaeta perfilievii]|uniref:DsbA family oxidoreductase n=1 Tax=Thiospirochaeta perfilievii TaxID=252967 RepID=A0A5C1QAV3_9SPIO|nr:DsbA family oxidoreductase [Thiospirochaeta perfilievii]QEN03926.1 DsbA family oxidoreductase [Thiospirochaeta perfilievii]
MKIEVWSDFACPFCYIGETKLNRALKELNLDDEALIVYKSFQLNPNATSQKGKDLNQLISEKYGIPYEQAVASNRNIVNVAKESGLNFNFNKIQPGNTALAHELHKYSETINKDLEMAEVIFKAYFEDGIDISDKVELIKLANKVGIKEEEVEDIFNNKKFSNAVIEDQNLAISNGINSVPFFVIDNKKTISGAQSIEHFKMVLGEN